MLLIVTIFGRRSLGEGDNLNLNLDLPERSEGS